MKRFTGTTVALLAAWMLLAPGWALAAGGKAGELVVVADTRIITNDAMRYIADLYNTDIALFAVWAVVLTAVYGALLGFLMDLIMRQSGLDLTSRKIVEH